MSSVVVVKLERRSCCPGLYRALRYDITLSSSLTSYSVTKNTPYVGTVNATNRLVSGAALLVLNLQ